jgi:hypothetical protein
MLARLTRRNVWLSHNQYIEAIPMLTLLIDISDIGQQLIEDNIVAVSRQMIDKEASVPSKKSRESSHTNGVNGSMDLDVHEHEL